MPSSDANTSRSGIVTDASGARHIPSSTRADGTTRREIKIRPGYKPPEDVELYKNRSVQAFRNKGKGAGVPGADAAEDGDKAGAAASNKNAKRREARRKAKATGEDTTETAIGKEEDVKPTNGTTDKKNAAGDESSTKQLEQAVSDLTIDPEVENEKKIKRLKKKLREARELQQKKERGEGLLPDQLQKAIRIGEIIRELDGLGYDANGEPKDG